MSDKNYEKVKSHLQRKRRIINQIVTVIALLAMVFGLIWLVWILWAILAKGITGLSLQVFTEMTPAPNAEVGGLANAIVGSLLMVSLATFR